MDHHIFPSLSIIITFFLFVLTLLKIRKISKTRKGSTITLPPGPYKLPIIGNMHQLVHSSPHHRLSELAKNHGPLMSLKLGQVTHIVASSPETAKQVMKINDINLADRPRLLAMKHYDFMTPVFAPYGNYWRQIRRICTLELLSAKRVQSFRSLREDELRNLIGLVACEASNTINFTKLLYSSMNNIIARACFGERCKDQEAFVRVVLKKSELVAGFSIGDVFPSLKFLEVVSGMRSQLEKVYGEEDRILENIIDDHKKKVKDDSDVESEDFLDVLLRVQREGELEVPLTNKNIKGVVSDIFGAGTETSSSAVEWAISEMLKNPRVMEKAQAEIRQVFGEKGYIDETRLHELEYMKCVIKETFRLHPPLPLLLPRECRESCKIDGYDIPLGSRILINVWAIGRDPKYWTEPEKFNPERFSENSIDFRGCDFELTPFGAGRRMCPGLAFAMVNVELTLVYLLYHFNWKLPNDMDGKDLDMSESFGATVRRKKDLYLIPLLHCSPTPI